MCQVMAWLNQDACRHITVGLNELNITPTPQPTNQANDKIALVQTNQ